MILAQPQVQGVPSTEAQGQVHELCGERDGGRRTGLWPEPEVTDSLIFAPFQHTERCSASGGSETAGLRSLYFQLPQHCLSRLYTTAVGGGPHDVCSQGLPAHSPGTEAHAENQWQRDEETRLGQECPREGIPELAA